MGVEIGEYLSIDSTTAPLQPAIACRERGGTEEGKEERCEQNGGGRKEAEAEEIAISRRRQSREERA